MEKIKVVVYLTELDEIMQLSKDGVEVELRNKIREIANNQNRRFKME